MEKYDFEDEESSNKKNLEQEGLESTEEGFMEGYADDEKVDECAECGSAVDDEKRLGKEIDGESYVFCSKDCAEEFEENM